MGRVFRWQAINHAGAPGTETLDIGQAAAYRPAPVRGTRPLQQRSRQAGAFLRNGSRQRFVILAGLLAVCAATGGSYRSDMPSLLVLRPVLVLGIGVMAALPGPHDWRGLRAPAILLAVFAATMAVQLVPLPPGWWMAMPGHGRYAGVVALAPDAWRPISLVPDLTTNSLLALLPALAVLVAFAGMREAERWRTVWIVLALCGANIVVGLIQVAGGSGPTGIAVRDDEGVVTGLLANRNHGAVLLGATLPLVALLLRRAVRPLTRWAGLGAAAAVIVPLILLSGSRQGLALGAAALAAAVAMLADRTAGRRTLGLAVTGGGLAIALLVTAAVLSGRALSIARFEHLSAANDLRVQSLPVLLRMTRDFLPFGIGYGAFDPVYRGYEPDALLVSTYLNRAHNDWLETLMSGGLPALIPLAGFAAWLATRIAGLPRDRSRAGLAWAAVVIIAMLLAASLGDYPLRTGLLSSLFAVACCWLATSPAAPPSRDRPGASPRRGDRQPVPGTPA